MKLFGANPVTQAGSSSTWDWPGGQGAMFVGGTPDGATIKIQASPDGGATWIDTEASLTAVGIDLFTLPPCKIKGVITGGSGSLSVSMWALKITPNIR